MLLVGIKSGVIIHYKLRGKIQFKSLLQAFWQLPCAMVSEPTSFRERLWFFSIITPLHKRSHYTSNWFEDAGFMTWPSNSLDLNPIENLCSIIKMWVYSNGRQFISLERALGNIEAILVSITSYEILILTSSVGRCFTRSLETSDIMFQHNVIKLRSFEINISKM